MSIVKAATPTVAVPCTAGQVMVTASPILVTRTESEPEVNGPLKVVLIVSFVYSAKALTVEPVAFGNEIVLFDNVSLKASVANVETDEGIVIVADPGEEIVELPMLITDGKNVVTPDI